MADLEVSVSGFSGVPSTNIEITGYERILDLFRNINIDAGLNNNNQGQSPRSPSSNDDDDKEKEDFPVLPLILALVVLGGAMIAFKK